MTPETDNYSHAGECSDAEIETLIERLNSLKEGAQAAAGLARCGLRAIEPLRRFLLDGKPSGIFQPRQRTVEALAELRAKDVLIEYLTSDKPIPDPVDSYGEEAVVNTAARLLAGWRDEEIYQILLRLLRRKATPGLIDAVASFRRDDALMEFIAALGDSISRTFAEEALRSSGEAAHRLLRHAALAPCPDGDHETPSSLHRRRAALRLLSELQLTPEDGRMLAPLADARDPELAARAIRIILAVGDDQEQKRAVQRLIGMLAEVSWYLQMEIEGWLMEYSDIAKDTIEEEIVARQLAANDSPPSSDIVLRRLLALRRRIERRQQTMDTYEKSGGVCSMSFSSILFEKTDDRIQHTLEPPAFFTDLNLDQIIDAITAGRQKYDLKPFYYATLNDIDAIKYRQDIMQDLEDETLLDNIKEFSQKMGTMRQYLVMGEKLYFNYHKEGWFLEAVDTYCGAVTGLVHDLNLTHLKSRGFLALREYMVNYAGSDAFTSLLAETKKLKADLSTVKYCVNIRGNRVRVSKYESEIDYSADVEKTFEKFKQGAVKDYRAHLPTGTGMNHIEAKILDLVAQLYPDIFLNLDTYCTKHISFLDEAISVFDREVQFYVAYLEYVAVFKKRGLNFCYPRISYKSKEVYDYEGFDLALAGKLIKENSSVVCNDFYLKDNERIFVVTGPNQGGKTTFARTFGQLHYLANLGCPVPGREAQLFLFDKLFTHFEKEENTKDLSGKLQDDLIRIHSILDQATSDSILILNEIFTSTTLQDAVLLSKEVMGILMQLDLLCVCVTFLDELASLSEKTVSMVSTIVPENPALRTYKIVRRPADGLSYAISIAEKYHVTYGHLTERIKS